VEELDALQAQVPQVVASVSEGYTNGLREDAGFVGERAGGATELAYAG
jgi:hypothetical protein